MFCVSCKKNDVTSLKNSNSIGNLSEVIDNSSITVSDEKDSSSSSLLESSINSNNKENSLSSTEKSNTTKFPIIDYSESNNYSWGQPTH